MGLLCIIITSYTIALVNKRKWAETLPTSVFIIMLLTYAMGIINCLDKIWLLKGVIFLGCIAVLFFYLKKQDWKIEKEESGLPIGMLFFIGVSVGMAFVLSSHMVIEWDDLTHWGTTIKQMYYINAIPNGQNALSNYNDYQPIGALFVYWFLSDFKEFHEFLIFPLYYFSVLICLAPFYGKISDIKGGRWKKAGAFLICLLLPGAFASTAMVNLKIDSFVTVLFIFIIISIYENVLQKDASDIWNLLVIFSALSVMMLAKSVGIYLATIATTALLLAVLHMRNRNYIKLCVVGIGIEYIFYFSWKVFCRVYENSSHISANFGKIQKLDYLRTMKAILIQMPWFLYPVLIYMVGMLLFALFVNRNKISERGKYIFFVLAICIDVLISFFCRYGYLNHWFEDLVDDGGKEYITKHYIYYFCKQSVTFQPEENVLYGMSALECVMLITVIILMVHFWTESETYKNYLIVQVVLLIGFVVYVAGHLAMYRYMFFGREASTLAAYSRYLMMYLGGLTGSAYYLLYCRWIEREDKKEIQFGKLSLLMSIILLSSIPFTYMCIFRYHDGYFAERWKHRENGIAVAEKIRQEIGETEGGIWITNIDEGWIRNETKFYLAPDRGFSFLWNVNDIPEDDLQNFLGMMEGELNYLAVDMSKEFTEEEQRKLDKILEYYQIEEKKDSIACVYKL